MKIGNIFKKTVKTVSTTNVQKMDKTQLEQIVGGTDETVVNTTESANKYRVNTSTGEIYVNK